MLKFKREKENVKRKARIANLDGKISNNSNIYTIFEPLWCENRIKMLISYNCSDVI